MAKNTLGRNQVFAIKNADGTPFHDLVMYKATYDSVVMSLGDKITGEVYYKDNRLDVTMNEYIEFKRDPDDNDEEPVKFVLVSPPTIIKEGIVSDNSELKGTTKYSFEFYHPMYKLGNMPLTDIAVTSSEENYLSQNKTFSWCGTGNDFIAKLNANLSYSEWVVVASTNAQSAERLAMMPSDVPTKKAGEQAKSNVLSFDKNTIADGLRIIYETWDIPFVVDTLHQGEYYDINGNDYYSIAGGSKRFVVVVGMPSNEIIDTESGAGVIVQATSLATGNIYYNPQPINAQKGKKIIVESLTEGATPIILNSSHNGVIGTTSRTFEADTTIYIGLYAKSGSVRYIYDGDEEDIFVFRYGQGVGLKNNSRTPRNNKIITRISASGSEDNVPYGYPQIQWTGNQDWDYTINNASGMQSITVGGETIQAMSYPIYDGIVGGQKVRLIKHPFTRTRLMPSVYVDCVNKKVNPNNPQYDPDIELVDYYDADNTYENPIVVSSPSYEIHEFDGIKPELDSRRKIAILGAIPLNEDLTPADSWVDDLKPDSDEYTQSYFRITLPPLGFDVYACASITQQMQINMRSGACIGCTFEIQVDWDDYKVNFYDNEGNFDPAIGTGHPRDAQKYPNSTTSPINVTVKKETSTFGTLMPNIYQQPKNGDLFVILGISLPASYITEAQQRLDNTAKQYMRENNLHYFDYPLKFDEYFLAKHPSILRQIRTNTIVRFDYAGQILHLCVKQITIKFGEKALPQYNITLTDNIEVVLNQISQIANDVSRISTMAYQNAKQASQGGGGNAKDKLSKVSDDTASGLITFLKGIKMGLQNLFGWDADGNITANDIKANDVNVSGLLTSMRAKIDEIRSSNNSGSGLFESGWFATNNHNGHSYLEIDELLVRMKAVFMELEIRKETYSGGNVFYSPAGSVICKVECYKYDTEHPGEIIRLDAETKEIVRPFTAGGRMLALLSEKTGLFSHREVVTIQKEVDHTEVDFYRCYLIADDGTVQTRNWWRKYDQARCQTFNRAYEKSETGTSDQIDPQFDDNYVQRNMDGNRFFWRLVTNTGTTRLDDGKWYDYVDLSNRNHDEDTSGTYNYLEANGYVPGSDFPVVGDSIVCIGNRMDAERMNMIMLEVIGSDAPAIKIYRGINTFSLEGRKYMSVSPKKIQIRVGSIEYITDYGTPVPTKVWRDYWEPGIRYHYYDEMSHAGSTWLCMITDGYHWEHANGEDAPTPAQNLIIEGEGLFAYGQSGGKELQDRYYATAIVSGETIYKVRNYTTVEPSNASATTWHKEVSAGGAGTRGAFKSRVFARTNTDISSAQYTPTGGDYDNPWPGGADGTTQHGVTWYDSIPNGSAMLWSSVCTFSDGVTPVWSRPAQETDNRTQDVEFSLSEAKPDAPSGNVPYTDHSSEGWYDPSRNPTLPTGKTWNDMVWRAERKVNNGVYSGDWVITKILGEDGDPTPSYVEIQEAWSNEATASGMPSDCVETDWKSSTPPNTNNRKYLWRRSRTRVWDAATESYTTPNWTYVRLNGTNGTSIETKGVVESTSYLLDRYVRPYINGATVPESQKVAVSDGWAYVNNGDGHLYQWSDEVRSKSGSWTGWSSGWIDLGKFQGDAGATYYTHVAWGKNVIIGTPTYTPTQGQRTTPNASACEAFSPAPAEGYDFMGILIDQVSDDCTYWQNYTWKSVKGSTGPAGGSTATVYLYKRSASPISTVGITAGTLIDGERCLFYKFEDKKLYTNAACTYEFTDKTSGSNGWSPVIPSGNDPIYVTAAIAYSETATDNIGSNEWVTPAQFTENGINSATVFLYKRAASGPNDANGNYKCPQQTLYYKFADGNLYKDSALTQLATKNDGLNGWEMEVPATDSHPCYIIQAAALSSKDYDAIEVTKSGSTYTKNDWSGVRKLVEDGVTPTVGIDPNSKNWIINGVDTGIQAEGKDGTGIEPQGGVDSYSKLESTGYVTPVGGSRRKAEKGDAYVCNDPTDAQHDRHLFMWDGSVWFDLGEFKGEPGDNSYIHIAYATGNPLNVTTANVNNIGFTVDYAGADYDWWGFYSDNNRLDPGYDWSSIPDTTEGKQRKVEIVNTYKWNYMKGKDGNGVEYIYLLTKEGFTPTINQYSGDGTPSQGEFLPAVANYTPGMIYGDSQYWEDDPPASVSDEWPVLWWASRKYIYNTSTGTGSWSAFDTPTLHNRWSKDGPSSPFLSEHNVYYARNNSGTTAPTSGWGTAILEPTSSLRYVWKKEVWIYDAAERGRNLMRGTKALRMEGTSTSSWSKGTLYYSGSGGTITTDTIETLPVSGVESSMKIAKDNTSTEYGFAQGELPLKTGKLTMSCWIKGTSGASIRIQAAWQSDPGSVGSLSHTCNGEWEKISCTGTVGTATNYRIGYVYLSTANATLYVCGIKVEYGENATDWCVAPEDLYKEEVSISSIYNEGVRGDFKSTVFKRQNTFPSTPTGGSYDNPVPSGWSDGIPDGEAIVWASACTFYGAGGSSGWSTPRQMTDTADFDVEFSSVESPNPPSGHPNTNTQWSNTSGASTIWMATSEKHNGVWSAWQVSKIKGEKGDSIDITDPDVIDLITEIVGDATAALTDGLTVVMKPQVLIYNQDDKNAATFSTSSTGQKTTVEIYRGNNAASFTIQNTVKAYGVASNGSVAEMSGCAGYDNTAKAVWLSNVTQIPDSTTGNYKYAYDHGYIEFTVTVDPGTSTAKSYVLQVSWYLNRLGNRDTITRGDMATTYMSRTEYALSEVGGTNIMRGTRDLKSGAGTWASGTVRKSGTGTFSTVEDSTRPVKQTKSVLLITADSGASMGVAQDGVELTAGKITMSCWVKGNSGTTGLIQAFWSSSHASGVKEFTCDGTWQKIVHTGTANTASYSIGYVYVKTANASIRVCGFKVERGEKATDWSPAPEDEQNDLAVMKTDYEGKIESSASGLRQDYTKKISDATSGLVTEENFASYRQTATDNFSQLQNTVNGHTTSISTIQQTANAISMNVYEGSAILYNHSTQLTVSGDGTHVNLYNSSYDKISSVSNRIPSGKYYIRFSAEVNFDSRATSGCLSLTFYLRVGGGTAVYSEIVVYPEDVGTGKWMPVEIADEYTSKIDSFDSSGYEIDAYNDTGYSCTVRKVVAEIVSGDNAKMIGAGINISARRIDMLADNFTLTNNSGEQTMGVDENGDVDVTGTIRSKNFYHDTCLYVNGGTYSTKWYYCKSRNDDRTIAGGYVIGKYYNKSGLDGNNDFVQCTYNADVVICVLKYNESWSGNNGPCLPKPEDFKGKIVEINPVAYGTSSQTVKVGCVVTGKFAATVIYDSTSGVKVTGNPSVDDFKSVRAGYLTRFLSIEATNNGVKGWYWMILNSN